MSFSYPHTEDKINHWICQTSTVRERVFHSDCIRVPFGEIPGDRASSVFAGDETLIQVNCALVHGNCDSQPRSIKRSSLPVSIHATEDRYLRSFEHENLGR